MAPLYILNLQPLSLAHNAAIPCYSMFSTAVNKIIPRHLFPAMKCLHDNLSDIMFHTNSNFLTGLAYNDSHIAYGSKLLSGFQFTVTRWMLLHSRGKKELFMLCFSSRAVYDFSTVGGNNWCFATTTNLSQLLKT